MMPDEQYLVALGKRSYSIAYTEWRVIEVIQYLDPTTRSRGLRAPPLARLRPSFAM